MSGPVWHILTGEFPPQPGGVGDYTAQVAAGLAAAGACVHVWTSSEGETPASRGVTVHRLGGGWTPSDLGHLGRELNAFPGPRRLLVQYTPNAWGYRGLNLGFCRWLVDRRRSRGDVIRLMFHEVAYPWQLRDRPNRWLLAVGHRWMARTLLKAGTNVDVATPAWEHLLRSCAGGHQREIGWRPVPSNIPVVSDVDLIASTRRRIAPLGGEIVGSFSTFSDLTGPLLAIALPRVLLDRPGRVGLLIGLGSERLAEKIVAEHPVLAGRLLATGNLDPVGIALHLKACDLVIQLYPDGITTRRGSLMASLSNGMPVVSNLGHLTEPFWAGSGAVGLARGLDDVASVSEKLLDDAAERGRLGASGRELYDRRFALELTVAAILVGSPGVDP